MLNRCLKFKYRRTGFNCDITAGVKRAWNVTTAGKYSFFHS